MATQTLDRETDELVLEVERLREICRSAGAIDTEQTSRGNQPVGVDLCLERSDVSFGNVRPDVVQIRLTVRNRGTRSVPA